MVVGRVIGWILVLAALAAFAYEVVGAFGPGGYALRAGGELWYQIHSNSLVGFQALIEKQLAPWLWSAILQPILLAPAWAALGVPGLLLALLCRHRRRKRRRLY